MEKRRTVIGRPKIVILYNTSFFFQFSNRLEKAAGPGIFNKKPPLKAGVLLNGWNGLFAHYFKFNFNYIAISEVNGGFMATQFFNFVGNVDALAIDLITFLVTDSTGNL